MTTTDILVNGTVVHTVEGEYTLETTILPAPVPFVLGGSYSTDSSDDFLVIGLDDEGHPIGVEQGRGPLRAGQQFNRYHYTCVPNTWTYNGQGRLAYLLGALA